MRNDGIVIKSANGAASMYTSNDLETEAKRAFQSLKPQLKKGTILTARRVDFTPDGNVLLVISTRTVDGWIQNHTHAL